MIEGTGYLKEIALENMYNIREANVLPEKLVNMHFSFDDLDQWILTLETRITRNGKNIDVLTKT